MTLLPNGKVLVTGGYNGSSTASVSLYDPATNTWSAAASMGTARHDHTATLLPDGKVLVAGGSSGSSRIASSELYDPATNTWSAAASMGGVRGVHMAVLLLNGKVLVAGGIDASAALATAQLYDPATDTWSPAGTMVAARYNTKAVLLPGGKVLIPGGRTGTPVATAEVYDPASNTWTATANTMANAREHASVTVLPGGKVLVAGGNGSGVHATADLYDPATNSFSATGSMATARLYGTAVLLSNGKVLVAGGLNGSALTSTELYDPAAGTWSVLSALSTGRYDHKGVLLASGKVLVGGGYNGGYLASAELYDAGLASAPTSVSATGDNVQATVTFAAPASDGGFPISGYTVVSSPAGGTDSNAGSTSLSHVVTGLANGVTYTFTVVPANANGNGVVSNASNSVTPATVPDAPTAVTATAGNAQATVSFSAPLSNGGSAITGYTVISNPAGGVDMNAGSTSTSHLVIGLSNGVAYTFTVKATNVAGDGAGSTASNSVTPVAPANSGGGGGSTPAIPTLPGTGNGSTPAILDMTGGIGPQVLSDVAGVLSTRLNVVYTFAGQSSSGAVLLNATDGSRLAFTAVGFQAGDTRANGLYPVGNGQYVVVAGGNALTITPAVLTLDQLINALPGAAVSVSDKGVITANLDGTLYSVQPDVFLTRSNGGAGQVVIGIDGVPSFTDLAGNTQRLNPAFADFNVLQDAARSLDGNAQLAVELDGSVTLVLSGQRLTLMPELTLSAVPADRQGQLFWQEAPGRYRVTNGTPVNTTQGFTVK